MPKRGRVTGSRVVVPPAKLSPKALFSRTARLFSPDEREAWAGANAALLELYGLTLASCRHLRLRDADRAAAGKLETDHADRLIATAGLAALAVAARGRAALQDLPAAERKPRAREIKEENDRAATCAMAEGIHAFTAALGSAVCEIAIGEGARLKPGEKGGNPTLYTGQRFGPAALADLSRSERAARGATTYSLAVDTVEGTSKSAEGADSSGSLIYITDSEVPRVPDLYFNKCQLRDVPGVHVDTDLPELLAAIARARGTEEINVFSLDRPRHPIEEMAGMGANVRTDAAGDAFPVVAAGLEWGVFPDNGRPLDGVCGNIGGAAEMIASAAAGHYMGVRSTARFAAKKIDRWDGRYEMGPGEAEEIRAAGFDPVKVYAIEDLVPEIDRKEGLFLAAAITDDAHVPLHEAAFWGGNFAEVSVLTVGASGAADLYRLSFAFRGGERETRDLLTPWMDKILPLPSGEIREAVRRALSTPANARRLRNEFATSFYSHFTEKGGRFALDTKSAEAVESEAAVAFMRALTEAASDWFA